MGLKTILIVDDAESICLALASVLTKRGYSTMTAFNGEEAVRIALERQPDAILLDLMMPVLDGWGAVKRLKESKRTAAIPVLALTALRISPEQAEDAGFVGYLEKPVTSHRLAEELEKAIAGVQ